MRVTNRSGGQRSTGKRSAGPEAPPVALLPSVLHGVLSYLPQQERVRVSEVCRAWREASLAPQLWDNVALRLATQDDEAKADSFLAWLLLRGSQVRALHVDVLEPPQVPGLAISTMANITAAIMHVSSSLRNLTIETGGTLVLSHWASALTQLESACFVAGEVHLKMGLHKLQRLQDLEFGSNNTELEIDSPLCWPTGITHLSLEHCGLSRLPCLTRMAQLRSLDVSQNSIGDEGGGETAALRGATQLECLKLANCRMASVPPELSCLRSLRILHLGGNLEDEAAAAEQEAALDAALRGLRNLQVLVISQCHVMLPDAVRRLTRLERLFVTSTPLSQLQPGAYCRSIQHLCVDWDVAFESHAMLQKCSALQILTLARYRNTETDEQPDELSDQLTAALLHHPALKQVNVVATARSVHLSSATLRFVLALSAAPQLRVEVVDSWDSDLVRIPNLAELI